MPIYRFIQHCKPAPTSRTYHPWQTADVVLLISAPSREQASQRRLEVLQQQRWEILQTREKSTLVEERVREAGGPIWLAYQTCAQRGYWVQVFPDHFAAGKDGIIMRAPRLGEPFVDRLVIAAGGRRLTAEERGHEKTRNVDYRLLGYLVEHKDIQEEGLEKPERQSKLAELFAPYFPNEEEVLIDPSILSGDDIYRYADIVGEPLKSQIKSASDQIRSSQTHLGDPTLKGGLILLNSGYFTLPDEVFYEQACRYARKDSSRIAFVVSITCGLATDGFNQWLNFTFLPSSRSTDAEKLLFDAFNSNLDQVMTAWGRSGFQPPDSAAPVPAPVTFVRNNQRFTFYPQGLPPPWTPE